MPIAAAFSQPAFPPLDEKITCPSEEEIAEAEPFEPALEQLLRKALLCEELICIIQVQGMNDRETFTALASSIPEFRAAAKDLFGVDIAKGPTNRLMQFRIVKAWNATKHHSEAQLRVDSNASAHGEAIIMPSAGWMSLVDQFRLKYGAHLHDNCLPSQSDYKSLEEDLADGQLNAETLAHVISLAEEERQRSQKPEPSRPLGLHLDSTLTIQICRKYISSAPTSTAELRDKYAIMGNMWLLAQLRQPGRHLCSDLTPHTRNELFSELLSTRNFRLEREVYGVKMVVPQWSHCLEYEFQIRKDAIRLTRLQGRPIATPLWTVYRNEQHRMDHWVTLLTIANASSSSSVPPAMASQMAAMQKQIAALQGRDRSRTPAGKGKKTAIAWQPQPQLALMNQEPAAQKGKGKAKKGKSSKGKGKGPAPAASSSFRKLQDLKKIGTSASGHCDRHNQLPGICFNRVWSGSIS